MSIIKPQDVQFVLNNEDGTSTVGVGYVERDKNGNPVDKIRNQVVSRREGNQLGELLKKKQAEEKKIRNAAGAPPPQQAMREMRVIRGPNGRPLDMSDVMKTRRR